MSRGKYQYLLIRCNINKTRKRKLKTRTSHQSRSKSGGRAMHKNVKTLDKHETTSTIDKSHESKSRKPCRNHTIINVTEFRCTALKKKKKLSMVLNQQY